MSINEIAASLDTIDPDAIRAELANLDGRVNALRLLLRAAVARERRSARVLIPQTTALAAAGKGGRGVSTYS